MKIFIVSEKGYEIKQIREFFARLPYGDFGKDNVLDFYQEEVPNTALERLNSHDNKEKPYDLIVVSHRMKALSGVQFSRSIRSSKTVASLPIMLLVDQMTKELVTEAMGVGVTGFFSLPLTQDGMQVSMARLASILLSREQKKVKEELVKLKSASAGSAPEKYDEICKDGAARADKCRMFAPWAEEAYTVPAALHMDAGNHKAAIARLKMALGINPANKSTHHSLLACYKKTGQAMEESSTLKKLLTANPNSAELLAKLGDTIMHEGNYKEAALYFRKAIENHGAADSARLKARSHIGLGKALMAEGDEIPDKRKHEMAKEEFTLGVAADPTLVSAYLNLLSSYKKLGMEKEARGLMEKAVNIMPDSPDGWLDLFSHYLDEGEMQKAKFSLQRAIQYDPESQVILVLAGQIYLHNRLFGEAVALFEKAAAINPSDTRVYNYLGISYRRMELNEQAIGNFKKAINIDPDDCNLHFNLGRACQQVNDLAMAQKSYENAIRLNKDFAEAKIALGSLAKVRGDSQSPKEQLGAG